MGDKCHGEQTELLGRGAGKEGEQDMEEEFAVNALHPCMKMYLCNLVTCAMKNNKAQQLRTKVLRRTFKKHVLSIHTKFGIGERGLFSGKQSRGDPRELSKGGCEHLQYLSE